MNLRRKFLFCCVLILVFGVFNFHVELAQAISIGEERVFNIDPDYDSLGRSTAKFRFIKATNKLYFYADQEWLNSVNSSALQDIDNKLYSLASEFEYNTYPVLTHLFGAEDNPGVDNDPGIVILLHKMESAVGGYIRTQDHYSSQVFSDSNMGQIIYLNTDSVLSLSLDNLSYHLAHEFTHLITLNHSPNEEVWLNEARAEYVETLLGYGEDWNHSNLRNRLQQFLKGTDVTLLEWHNNSYDYAKVNLFVHYLVGLYGVEILADSLDYGSGGTSSLDYALKQNGFSEDTEDIFIDWLIASVANDCSLGAKYCYQYPFLQNFTVFSSTYYLPGQTKSSLSVTDSIRAWEAKWQKISGGSGIIKLKFIIPEDTPIYKIPYIIESASGRKMLGFLDFSASNVQELYVEDMGTENKFVYFIPLIGSSGEQDKVYYYSWEVENLEPNDEQQIIEALLRRIEELKMKIVVLQTQSAMQKAYQNTNCSVFAQDLHYGMSSDEVKCLQTFLVNLGPDIYPEGLITGYFGSLTQAAVKRYQEFKGIITTGYFGPLTRAAANQNL